MAALEKYQFQSLTFRFYKSGPCGIFITNPNKPFNKQPNTSQPINPTQTPLAQHHFPAQNNPYNKTPNPVFFLYILPPVKKSNNPPPSPSPTCYLLLQPLLTSNSASPFHVPLASTKLQIPFNSLELLQVIKTALIPFSRQNQFGGLRSIQPNPRARK
jgi:hypothetical protein